MIIMDQTSQFVCIGYETCGLSYQSLKSAHLHIDQHTAAHLSFGLVKV